MERVPIETFLKIVQPFRDPEETRQEHQQRVTAWASLNRWTAAILRPLIYTELYVSCQSTDFDRQLEHVVGCTAATALTRSLTLSGLVEPGFDSAVHRRVEDAQLLTFIASFPRLEDLSLVHLDLLPPLHPRLPKPPATGLLPRLSYLLLRNVEVYDEEVLYVCLSSLPEILVLDVTRVRWTLARARGRRHLQSLPRAAFISDAYCVTNPSGSADAQTFPLFTAAPPPSHRLHHLHLESEHRLYPLDKALDAWESIPVSFLSSLRSLSLAVDFNWERNQDTIARLTATVATLLQRATGPLCNLQLHLTLPPPPPHGPPEWFAQLNWLALGSACRRHHTLRVLDLVITSRSPADYEPYLTHVCLLLSPLIFTTYLILTPGEHYDSFQSPAYRRLD